MTALEKSISGFTDWSNPWKFKAHVTADKNLTAEDLKLFEDIWLSAGKAEWWNYPDLAMGCKKSKDCIIEHYTLNEFAADQIVRAISYQWR